MGMLKSILHIPNSRYSARVVIRWLWTAWRGNRLQAVLNASTGVISVALSLSSVWAMQRAIDIASGVREGSVLIAVGLMAMLILCEFGVSISRVWIKNILGIKAQNRMQSEMLDRLLRSEWRGKEQHHSGDIVNRLESDVTTVVTFLTETLPNTLSVLLMFIGAFVYLVQMDVVLSLITVGILPLFILMSRIYIGQMRKFTRRVRRSDSKVQSILQEAIQNRMLIKTLECDTAMVDKLNASHTTLRSHVRRRTSFSVVSNLILNLGFSFGYIVAFLWGAIRLSQHTITFGGMTAFLQLVYRIQNPARDLTKLAPAFVAVFTAAERLMELEEMPEEDKGEAIVMAAPCGVRLDNVSYAYSDGNENVVNNLSFDFKPGSCTAVLGETGAGKTTLIRLMLALLRPNSGKIEIYNSNGGEPVSPSMRCNFVYVPQGNTLLSGTIRENLRLGNPKATGKQMHDALYKACADFVFDLPDGIDTKVTEDGGGLSEGQAQRISIARALLRNRSIMLFDEATSALDPHTERTLLKNVLSSNDKTVIFITHRLAVVDYCDQTLRL